MEKDDFSYHSPLVFPCYFLFQHRFKSSTRFDAKVASRGHQCLSFCQNYTEGLFVHFVCSLSLSSFLASSLILCTVCKQKPVSSIESILCLPAFNNPHHSTLAASTVSMHVLVNRCSFPVQTHKPRTERQTHTRHAHAIHPKPEQGRRCVYVPTSCLFFFVSLRADTAGLFHLGCSFETLLETMHDCAAAGPQPSAGRFLL